MFKNCKKIKIVKKLKTLKNLFFLKKKILNKQKIKQINLIHFQKIQFLKIVLNKIKIVIHKKI